MERCSENKIRLLFIAVAMATVAPLWCVDSFTGYAGGMAAFDTTDYSLGLRFQAFFAGQFNFTPNTIGRLEFSLKTEDLIEENIFKSTSALFKLDELSLIHKSNFTSVSNYISAFVGTYEPIGSDIFLRRHFGITPITSKITESWLGLSGSVVCPLFGLGLADVVQLSAFPLALGVYSYVNMDGYVPLEKNVNTGIVTGDEDLYAINFDLRMALALQYLTCDLAAGLCVPFEDDSEDVDKDAILVIKRLNMHCGLNLLLGNNSTLASLFVQAGFHRLTFSKSEFDKGENIYLLFEPRVHSGPNHVDFTLFNFPQESADNFLLIDGDRLGCDIAVYTDAAHLGSQIFSLGVHATVSTVQDGFSLLDDMDIFDVDDFHVTLSPFIATKFFTGNLRTMLRVRFTDFVQSNSDNAVRLYVGYKTQM